jgi:ABC-type multidrug transport system permease subunit
LPTLQAEKEYVMKHRKNWLTESIIVTAFNAVLSAMWIIPCIIGVPMGVMGILKACEAEKQTKLGKENVAAIYSASAKKWAIWSCFVALLGVFFAIAIFLTISMFGFMLLQSH